MRRIVWRRGPQIALISALTLIPILAAAQTMHDGGAAPAPAQILSAKTAFVSNLGGEYNPQFGFSGGPDRAYNEFYAGLKSWGRYELAGSPADAELDFEISFACPAAGASVIKGGSVGPSYDPELRLSIRDVKTHIVLWGLTEHVSPALLESNRNKNFELALNTLLFRLKELATPGPAGATTDQNHD